MNKKIDKIYTTLEDPNELRIDLLRANVKIIEMLEDMEKLKELRNSKYNTFLFLKAYIKEIHSSVNSLGMRFPHLEFDQEEELRKDAEKINLEFKGYLKPDKEVDKLEIELSELKEKLKEVS